MRVVVYTTDVGHHDPIWPHVHQEVPRDWEVSWVHLADDYSRAEEAAAAGWGSEWLGLSGQAPLGLHDRLLARWAKCHPHVLLPATQATIWVDACLEVTSPTFVRDAVGQVSLGRPYAAFTHPDRENVHEEVEAAETLAKYEGNRHAEMVRTLGAALPHGIMGLWAMTVLVRRAHHAVRLIDRLVWTETLAWSTDETTALDQLILPWVLDVLRDDLQALDVPHPTNPHEPGTLWANAWFTRHPHRRES